MKMTYVDPTNNPIDSSSAKRYREIWNRQADKAYAMAQMMNSAGFKENLFKRQADQAYEAAKRSWKGV